MTPFQRGFFCNDQSLRYPYSDCTISVPMLAIFMLLMPLLFISVIEVIRICNDFRLRRYLWNLWHNVAAFSFGFIATYLMAELAKRLIGRLRPHFYAACEPRLPDGSAACSANDGGGRYIERYICANRNLSLSQQRELQMSFPSSHSALSFFSMIFLCFYLHAAWQSGHVGCRYLRHLLQFIMLMLAWSIALSRVTDYWHHWSDVLAGVLLGVAFAVLAAVYVGDLLNSARNRQQAGKKQQRKQRLEQLQQQHQQQQQQHQQQQQQHHHQQHQQQQLLQKSASDWKLQTVLAT